MNRALIWLAAALLGHSQAGVLTPLYPPLDPKAEVRICGEPAREADGTIKRSAAILYAFRKLHPCPANGSRFGACPGWAINHVVPLAKGGCDAVFNLQWLPVEIKSCAHPWCIDRWERTYWGEPYGIVVIPPETPASAP